MNDTNEALKIWNALKPMVTKEIERLTRSCVRARKMQVKVPPNGSTIGVAEPYGETIQIPYSFALSEAREGDAVWVWEYFSNASTMIALAYGNGQLNDFYSQIQSLNQTAQSLEDSVSQMEEDFGAQLAELQSTMSRTEVMALDSENLSVSGQSGVNYTFTHDLTGYTLVSKTCCLLHQANLTTQINLFSLSISGTTANSASQTTVHVTNSGDFQTLKVRLILFLQKNLPASTAGE